MELCYDCKKIGAAISLLLIIAGLSWSFFHFFPISTSSDESIRLFISILPVYFGLYLCLLIHWFNYIQSTSYSISVTSYGRDEWNTIIQVNVQTSVGTQLQVEQIESLFFKTIFLQGENQLKTDPYQLHSTQTITLELRQEYRDGKAKISKARSLSCTIYFTLLKNMEKRSTRKEFTNLYLGKK